jgi:aspartyl protease family protein
LRESHSEFSDASQEEPVSNGILASTLRNVAILAVICLSVLFFMDFSSGPQAGQQSGLDKAQTPDNGSAFSGPASELQLRANAAGNFIVKGEINGTTILFIVDTGASKVSLSPQDAQRIGFRDHQLDFTEQFSTANGIVRGAPVTLRRLRIGRIEMYDVEASVHDSPMRISLLGMTFLSRLDSYEVQGDKMTMAW